MNTLSVKKIACLLIIAVTSFCPASSIERFRQGLFDFYVFENTKNLVGVSIADVKDNAIHFNKTVLEIPQQIEYKGNTYTVCRVESSGFMDNTCLQEVVVPEGVKEIGDLAFYGCTSLESIRISSSVRAIGDRAFAACPNLRRIVVDEKNPVFDSRLNCNAIIESKSNTLIVGCQTTEIPNAVEKIATYAFLKCTTLSDIQIPEGIREIDYKAFAGCRRLTRLSLPNSLKSISGEAFDECALLKEVHIPCNVETILYNPFTRCVSLERITVDLGNKYYDSRRECNAIVESKTDRLLSACSASEITADIKVIEFFAFCGLLQLNRIDIPASVQTIKEGAIVECPCLVEIHVDKNNATYYVQSGCVIERDTKTLVCGSAFSSIPNDVSSIASHAFRGVSSASSIVIPANVKKIGMFAFYGCNSIKHLYISSRVKSIGLQAFSGCKGLRSVEFEEGHELIHTSLFSFCSNLSRVVIPASVKKICQYAFLDCASLNRVYLSDSTDIIEHGAFPEHTQKLIYHIRQDTSPVAEFE